MPILTISEVVNSELANFRFMFGGSPADVVEYSDGGRMASGQARSVEGLEAVTNQWVVQDPSVIPTADGSGVVPEFYGPPGILALRVDFGFGMVVLRADAAGLHRELHDLLLDRLSQLQVDEDNFRAAVSAEVDAMRSQIDSIVASTLDQVTTLIQQQQGSVIEQVVDDKLASDLAPTLASAIDDAMANRVPPLIEVKVPPVVATEVSAQLGTVHDDINTMQALIDAQGVNVAGVRYDLDATRNNVTNVTSRVTAVEAAVKIFTWQASKKIGNATITLKGLRLQNLVIMEMDILASQPNKGGNGFVSYTGMGIPTLFIPKDDGAILSAAGTFADGTLVNTQTSRIGIGSNGDVYSQCYAAWNDLRGTAVYFNN